MKTIRVLVVADTHLPRRGRELPKEVFRAAETVDLIIHLGDFTELSVLEQFEMLGHVEAVSGNNDSLEIKERFAPVRRIELGDKRLLLLHGHVGGRTAVDAARRADAADVVLFGHSHAAHRSIEDGRLLFNPGSPTDRRFSPYRSFGLLKLGETIEAEIVRLL